MVYLIALYCLQVERPSPYLRVKPSVEAPACMEHKEEWAGTVEDCNTRGVVINAGRLRALYGNPISFQGAYCRREARG